jgi:Ran GTPase-activating protein (RanGAP) involved in mRNA processing and transport
MGALLALSLEDNRLATKEGGKALAQALASNSTLKELDVSSNNWRKFGNSGVWMGDGPGFAQELAIGIKDNGAISSVNVLQNGIRMEQAMALASILKEHPTLKSLCGNKGNEVELDMSNKGFGVAGAIMLAPEIIDNGAMTSLNLASNHLGAEGAKIVAVAIKVTKCTPAIILAPFSCPSDFSINCCCLLLSAGYEGNVDRYHVQVPTSHSRYQDQS